MRESTQYVNVQNPERVKPQEPTDSKVSLRQGIQQGAQRQQPLALKLRLAAVTVETHSLYRSLSLSLYYALYSSYTQ